MEFYCFLRNIVDTLKDGKTAFEKRFDKPWCGPYFHFGEQLPGIQVLSMAIYPMRSNLFSIKELLRV